MDISQCKPGSFYTIQHKRKGQFYARYAGMSEREGYATFDVLTWPGNGMERFANAVVHIGGGKYLPVWSRKDLLLSLVTSISAPSSAVQSEWKARASSAETEYTRLSGRPVDSSTAPEAPEVTVPEEPKGFWKRLFGGNA